VETAHGGTLLIEDATSLELSTQARLLRVVETRQVYREESNKAIEVDVRIVSTASPDLETMVQVGTFRNDLRAILGSATLTLPPLRDRQEDIEPLARHFLAPTEPNGPPLRMSPQLLDLVRTFTWSGNAAQLRDVIECARDICVGSTLTADHVDVASLQRDAPYFTRRTYEEQLRILPERERILAALIDGNPTLASSRLNISRDALMKMLDEHGIPRQRMGLLERK
jgi:DNA-binding NtrC family response regulator